MPRIKWNDFSRGWWPLGPGDDIPQNALREAIGIRPFYGGRSIRSRHGMELIAASVGANIQSLYNWHGSIFYTRGIKGSGVLRRLIGSTPTDVITGLGGGPLRFATGIPTPDTNAGNFAGRDVSHLFVVGGGLQPSGIEHSTSLFPLRKVNASFGVSPMGLNPPQDNFVVGLQGPIPIVYDSFDLLGIWQTTNASKALSPNLKQQGAAGLQVSVTSEQTGSITATHFTNLGTYNTGFNGASGVAKSSKQDWIRLWVHCVDPSTIDKIDLQFDCTQGSLPGNLTDGWTQVFSFAIHVADGVLDEVKPKSVTDTNVGAEKRDQKPFYAGGSPRPANSFNDPEQDPNINAIEVPDVESAVVVDSLATTRLSPQANSWTLLRIPKMLFDASQPDMVENHSTYWSRVRRVRLSITANDKGNAVCTFDQLDCHIGAGMQGDYKVALTSKNSKTGTRSMPTAIKEVKGNLRQAIIMSNITVDGETSQYADQVEIWRTVGGGNVLFFNKAINIQSVINATLFDFTADFEGMQENCPLPGLGDTRYLKQIILPQDNVRLHRTTFDIAGPCLGRMWSVCKDQPGRVFYSPPGRLEVAAGFVDVSDQADPIVRVIYWNTIYVFTEKHIYRLRNEQEPFVFEEVFGAPGTIFGDSIIPSKFGIPYTHLDGVMLFDGVRSQLLAIEPVESFFQAVPAVLTAPIDATNFQTTHGRYAMFGAVHEEEYFTSDGITTVVVNMRTGVWRVLGIGLGPSHPEETFGHLVANVNPLSVGSSIVYDEISTAVSDYGQAIFFLIQTSEAKLEDQSGATKLIQRFYVDIDTGGNTLTLQALTDSNGSASTITANLVTSGRQLVEFAECLPCDILAMRISGDVVSPVTVYELGADVHLPEEGGKDT